MHTNKDYDRGGYGDGGGGGGGVGGWAHEVDGVTMISIEVVVAMAKVGQTKIVVAGIDGGFSERKWGKWGEWVRKWGWVRVRGVRGTKWTIN